MLFEKMDCCLECLRDRNESSAELSTYKDILITTI